MKQNSSKLWITLGLAVLAGVGILVGGVYYLLQPETPTARIRDIMIILLAVEGLFIGVALIALVVQLGVLVYVLYEELSPILRDLQETAHTVKGTTEFLSDQLARPVIRAKGYVAMLRTVRELMRWRRVRKK